MKPLIRGYLLLLAFLVTGAVTAWHILRHDTYNNCCGVNDLTSQYYAMLAICLGIVLGVLSGSLFAWTVRRRQFFHALMFSLAVTCIVFIFMFVVGWIMAPSDRYFSFVDWAKRHHVIWLDHIVFWGAYWNYTNWLFPQLASQLLAVAMVQWVVRCRDRAGESQGT